MKPISPLRVFPLILVLFLCLGVLYPAVVTAQTPSVDTLVGESTPQQVRDAIAKSLNDPAQADATTKMIKPGAEEGIMGIPGAPNPNLLVALLWAVFVGWIFSTVGAFGGVMSGVGHITVFGLGDYAKGFGKGHPVNSLMTDSIRVSNQWLTGLSALISSFNYYRMGRLVLPIALSLAIGSVAGSYLVPELTAGKVNLKDYIGFFGVIVLILGMYLFYQTTERGRRSQKAAKAAAEAFEKQSKEKKESGQKAEGVKILEGSMGMMLISLGLVLGGVLFGSAANFLFDGAKYVAYAIIVIGFASIFFLPQKTIRFSFFGVEFSFKAYIPAVGGFLISAIASFLGVGGGFLLVPFLTSVAGLPMFLVAGTSALAVLVGMVVSVFTYMVGSGVPVPWHLIGVELIGIFIGSMIGPRTQKYIPDIWLKRIFIVLAAYVGLRYTTLGFFGFAILPPF